MSGEWEDNPTYQRISKHVDEERGKIEQEQAKANGNVTGATDVADSAPAESGAVVLADVEKFLGRFVVYPSEHAKVAHVLWVAHTHLMDKWDSTPRIAFLSPEPASGKTRALEVSELLVPGPVQAVNVSPAYLFRKVGQQGGCTILFDEIDTVFGPKAKENEEVRGLLNAGHRRGAVAGRCFTRGSEVFTEEIPAYCAVALAGLGWLPDTILSRSVLIRMCRRKPGEYAEPFRRRKELNAGHQLGGRLALWAHHVRPTIVDWPEMPAGVEDRDADVWEALLAVADAAGGEWPKRAREAAIALIKEAHDVEPSLGVRLLADIKTAFGDADHMTTEAILRALHAMAEAPWNDLKGKPLNDRGLAQRLRQYGIKSQNIRVGPNPQDVRKGYTRQSFHDAWLSYPIPSSDDRSATSATDATSGENPSLFNAEDVADDQHGKRYSQAASATGPVYVADHAADVADHVADQHKKNVSENSNVTDVALVALPPETEVDNRDGICAQCGDTGIDVVLWDWHDGRKVPRHDRCADSFANAQNNRRLRVVGGKSE
jgi:Protein of unknown function (DUF3631)